MPIMTTLLASGGIVLAGLTGILPALATPAPHAQTASATVAVASTASPFSVSNYTDGQTVSSNRVALTGTAQPGSRVWLVRGNLIMAGGLTNDQGRWSLYQYNLLDSGTNDMKFIVDEASGAETEIPFRLTLGSTPVVKTAASTTRLSSVYFLTSSVTSEPRPVIEGLATPGATIEINVPSGAVIGHTVADSTGMFDVTLTHDLKLGYNELGLKQSLGGAFNVTSAGMTYTK
jgi:hypothetical protein